MLCRQQHRLRAFATTFFNVGHALEESLRIFGEELISRETELKSYIPQHRSGGGGTVSELVARWVQIRWSNWLSSQWDSLTAVPFPDLAILWERMALQEP